MARSISQQCALVAKTANHILGCIKHSTANQMKEAIVSLYSAMVGLTEYCVQFWALQYQKDIRISECVQKTSLLSTASS